MTLALSPSERAERLATAPPAVVVEGLSKTFLLPHQRYSTLKERALHPWTSRTFDELHAIEDATFTVARGEFFGIVGRNGSGKSTLLKCLAGIYAPDRGHTTIAGRLSPFIELGVGFNPELTARDNVLINAIMLGLTRRQARTRFDDIIDFAGLEEFVDLKLKNYSSGMAVRLAFAVAVQVDADVLLVDEVLAVGDVAFQAKCFEQFDRLKEEGRTIVFVTHDMSSVERFCDRAMLVERGRIVSIDSPEVISRAYNEVNFGRVLPDPGSTHAPNDRVADVAACWFEDEQGERVTDTEQGRRLGLCMEVRIHARTRNPQFAFHLRNQVRHTIFATTTFDRLGPSGTFEPGEVVTVRATLDNWLAPGLYQLTPTVAPPGFAQVPFDVRQDMASLIVQASHTSGGIVDVPHTLTVDRT